MNILIAGHLESSGSLMILRGFLDFQLVFEFYLCRLVYSVSRFLSNFGIPLYASGSINVALGIGNGQQGAIVWSSLTQIIALFGMCKCPIPNCQFLTFIESAICKYRFNRQFGVSFQYGPAALFEYSFPFNTFTSIVLYVVEIKFE